MSRIFSLPIKLRFGGRFMKSQTSIFGTCAFLCVILGLGLSPMTCYTQDLQQELDGAIEMWERRGSFESMLGILASNASDETEGQLGLDETQAAEIERLLKQYWDDRRMLASEFPVHDKLKPLDDPEKERARLEFLDMEARKVESILAVYAREMEKVLLPHQLTLARQTTFRRYFENNAPGGAASIPLALAVRLELSDEERKKLLEVLERVTANHERELRLAREKAAETIENALSSGALTKLQEMAGVDWYERVFVR
jgi:hypothetical protein